MVENSRTDISEAKPIRWFRMEASYTAARLGALEETRPFAKDFTEAADKFALLEAEQGRLDIRRVETQAMVETADDAWDDTMMAFQRRLLELSGHSTDAELYRQYFADIPSQVTSLSYAAEIMISEELERHLMAEGNDELSVFADRLSEKRHVLENILRERTWLEVEEARFANRVSLAKSILNKLRRTLESSLAELARTKGRAEDAWAGRFFWTHNEQVEAVDTDGVEDHGGKNGETSTIPVDPSAEASA
jgi:hypothetical protein